MRSRASRQLRLLGLAALVGGLVALLYWPFYSISYHATPEGAESGEPAYVQAWAGPFHDAVAPLVEFAEPNVVYVTWGKALTLATAGWLLGLVGLARWPGAVGGKLGKAALRLAFVATGLLALASVTMYWTPWIDVGFIALAVPGLLLTMVAYALLGFSTLRARVLPRATSILWLVGGPAIIPLAQPLGSLSGGLVLVAVGWIVGGLALRRQAAASPAAPASGSAATEGS